MATNANAVVEIVSKIVKKRGMILDHELDLVAAGLMDSMQRVEVVIELEKAFDIVIPDEDAVNVRSISQIVELVNRKMSVNK